MFLLGLFISIFIYISIYLYISTVYIYIEKKNAKEYNVLLRSFQKNVAFSAFFYVLKKRTQGSFGSHKSPKTWKKNVAFFKRMEKNDAFRTEKNRSAQPWVYSTTTGPFYTMIQVFSVPQSSSQSQAFLQQKAAPPY